MDVLLIIGGSIIMIPYYLLNSNDFKPTKINSLCSESQVGIDSVSDNTPFSSIQKRSTQGLKNFVCYDLITETLKRQKGKSIREF